MKLFDAQDKTLINFVSQFMEVKICCPDEHIIYQNEDADRLYLIHSGKVSIYLKKLENKFLFKVKKLHQLISKSAPISGKSRLKKLHKRSSYLGILISSSGSHH